MKTLHALPFALLLCAGTTTAALQDGTLLRRSLTVGSTDTYLIEDKVQQTVKGPTGDLPMTISSKKTYVIKVAKADEKTGIALFEATTTVDAMDGTGVAGSLTTSKPKPFTSTGKIDVRGRMTVDRSAANETLDAFLSGSQSATSAGSFVELPEKAVKVGDTWDIVVPKSPLLFDADQHLTAKLVGEKDLEGTPVWVVSVVGKLKTAVDSSKIPGAKQVDTPAGPTTIRVTGDIEIHGEGLVEKVTGRTLAMASKSTMRQAVELAEYGISFETTGVADSTIKLKKG